MSSNKLELKYEKQSSISICALVQGWYGYRMVSNIKNRIPNSWEIKSLKFPQELPVIVEDIVEILPAKISRCELILSLGENPIIASLLPDLVKITGAKAVIVPIDNSSWVPLGIKKQISEEFDKIGVAFAFPKPFCSMVSNSNNGLIDDFSRRVGKPILKIEIKNDTINRIKVIRGSPCGATHYVAEMLTGMKKSEAAIKASLLVQTYPCLASRKKDPEFGKSLIHLAAYITRGEVLKSLS